MKRLHFDYEMQIEYSVVVSRCHFTIKCIPKDTKRQKISDINIELYPSTQYTYGVDGFKNVQIYGVNEADHTKFAFRIQGYAETGLAAYEEAEDEDISMVFGHPYGLNVPGPAIKAYYAQLMEEIKDKDVLLVAEAIMHRLHRDFTYQPCSTTVDTPAEEAWAQGMGVCQDYAHIYIALLHLAGIRARYVTGLLIGEGASHAWVEVLCDHRWYGFDPTNDVRVTEDHIKIGVGRDAKDCMINRGIMHGGGLHIQSIRVAVQETAD